MWELKKAEGGHVFGPVDLGTLKRWAANGQISPLDIITDLDTRKAFAPFEISELEMIWEVTLEDGAIYGPAHANAVRMFVRDGQLSAKDTVRDILRGEKFFAGEFEPYLAKQYPLQKAEPPPAVQTVAAPALLAKEDLARKDETRLRPAPPEPKNRNAQNVTRLSPIAGSPSEQESLNEMHSKMKQIETALHLERMNYEKLKQHYQDLNQRYIELKDRVKAVKADLLES